MRLRDLSSILFPSLVLTTSIALAGCVGGEKTTDSAADDSSSSSSSSTTKGATSEGSAGGTTSGGESSSGATTHDSHTTSATTADATASTTASTTADPTGGGGIPESCLEACETLLGCFPIFPTIEECVETCVDESTPSEPDPECEAASLAFNTCLASLTCEQLEGEGEDFPCDAAEEAVQGLCGGGEDECFGGGGIEEESCSLFETCRDYDYEVQCSAAGCICFESGVETKSCPPSGDNACEDLDTLSAAALACCGWDL